MGKGYKITKVLALIVLLSLVATPALARSISLKDAGVALWIFVIIGAVIILLQLIPAAILFFTFVGTATGLIVKKKAPKKAVEEEKATLPGFEPAPVKR